MKKKIMILLCLLTYSYSLICLGNWKNGHVMLHLGGFNITQGRSQFIGINGLIGNQYDVTQHQDTSLLLGIGYYFDCLQNKKIAFSYGIDAFLLPKTFVRGNVIQEQLFNNLDYRYGVIYLPIYAAIKTVLYPANPYALTIDLGVGPNIITTKDYREHSLDDGVTIPDNAFTSKVSAAFSSTVGIGLKIQNAICHLPLECGYRFFYLGESEFGTDTNQLEGNLKTGRAYAHAILFSVSF